MLIDRLLDGARGSRSGALVLRGEAGAGKSALLDEARVRAGDMAVLCCSGVESEAELPFAALHQLVRPLLSRIDALPAPQARALRAGARAVGRRDEHRFLVSVAVLEPARRRGGGAAAAVPRRRRATGSTRPPPTRSRSSPGAWRPSGSRSLFAARDGDARASRRRRCPSCAIDGLTPTRPPRCSTPRPRQPRHRRRAIGSSRPRAATRSRCSSCSSALSDDQRAGAEPLLGPLPVSERIERAFLVRVRRLPAPTQVVLLVAAADESGDLATVLDAAGRLGVAVEALDGAESADLVRVRGARLELRHPLVRSAVYQGAPPSRRRRRTPRSRRS